MSKRSQADNFNTKRRRLLGSEEREREIASPVARAGPSFKPSIRLDGTSKMTQRTITENMQLIEATTIYEGSVAGPSRPAGLDRQIVVVPNEKTRKRNMRRRRKITDPSHNLVTKDMWDSEDEDRELEEYFRRKLDRIGRQIQRWKKFVRDNGLPEDYYKHLFDGTLD